MTQNVIPLLLENSLQTRNSVALVIHIHLHLSHRYRLNSNLYSRTFGFSVKRTWKSTVSNNVRRTNTCPWLLKNSWSINRRRSNTNLTQPSMFWRILTAGAIFLYVFCFIRKLESEYWLLPFSFACTFRGAHSQWCTARISLRWLCQIFVKGFRIAICYGHRFSTKCSHHWNARSEKWVHRVFAKRFSSHVCTFLRLMYHCRAYIVSSIPHSTWLRFNVYPWIRKK